MASDGEISCANDPNFAVIYSFLKTFGNSYGLDIPTITKLQEFIENTQEGKVTSQFRHFNHKQTSYKFFVVSVGSIKGTALETIASCSKVGAE